MPGINFDYGVVLCAKYKYILYINLIINNDLFIFL